MISILTLPLRIIESVRFNAKIKNTKIAQDPIFIVGFYRTATTLMHTLLSLDDRLGYLTNVDGLTPLMNLSFNKLATRLSKKSLPPTRPMDNIEFLLDGPIEEEYALSAFYEKGITNALIFPKKFDYFTQFLSFENHPKELEIWKRKYHFLVQKISLRNNGKRLVLKNPANAFKIQYLLEMYPNAKFIYTYRDPYTLFHSMKRLFRKMMEISAVQIWDDQEIEKLYLDLFQKGFEKFEQTRSQIPPQNYIEVQYEKFVIDPLPFLRKIYEQFNLDDFSIVEPKILEYIQEHEKYQANSYNITQKSIELVNSQWEDYRKRFGYEQRK
jgi:hypothetical protein